MSKDDKDKAKEIAKKVQKDRSPTRTPHGSARPAPSRGGGKRGGSPQSPPDPKKGS